MDQSVISKKELIKFSLLALLTAFIIFIFQISDKKTKIVFCNVGQGDGIYLRIKNKTDVLIDAGPGKTVLNCLGKHMPFWDKKIELAFLSHHDKDHYFGYFEIIKRYQIDNFLTIKFPFDSQTYKKLENQLLKQKINYRYLYKNDIIQINNSQFILLWPEKQIKSYDSNDYSLIFLYKENNFKALFTGDASLKILNLALSSKLFKTDKKINILKVPHHGSKNNLNKRILQLIIPDIAIITVGKNSYGHPDKKILDLFNALKIKIKRTDLEGDIVFKIKN